MSTIRKIITHPGIFHADEVSAVALVWGFTGGQAQPVERRIPTPEDMADNSVLVLDVGGEYDPPSLNFDHHQRGGAGQRHPNGAPMAALGLIFDHLRVDHDPRVKARLRDTFVLAVDAADCGWGTLEGTRPELSFSACISGFNPPAQANSKQRDEAFFRAVNVALEVLKNFHTEAVSWVDARESVLSAEADNQMLILNKFAPWGEHVFSRPDQADLLYVIFPSERGGWMLQQVPRKPGSFEGRKPLPEAWAGLREQELRDVSGVANATFCHPGRFCGGAETKVGAVALARLAIEA